MASARRSVFGSARARSPSRARSLSQASRICPVIEAVSQAALIPKSKEEVAQAGRLCRCGTSSTRAWTLWAASMQAFWPSQPFRVRRPVRCPQAVPSAVFGLEQGQLGSGMRALAAREDAHRRGPGTQLVPARAAAQQPGQLGGVRFLDPARPVRAGRVCAGVISAALADRARGRRWRPATPAPGSAAALLSPARARGPAV